MKNTAQYGNFLMKAPIDFANLIIGFSRRILMYSILQELYIFYLYACHLSITMLSVSYNHSNINRSFLSFPSSVQPSSP